MGQTGLGSMMPNPGGSIQDQVLWAFTFALSWVASAVMWLMNIVRQMLYLIEIAVSLFASGWAKACCKTPIRTLIIPNSAMSTPSFQSIHFMLFKFAFPGEPRRRPCS